MRFGLSRSNEGKILPFLLRSTQKTNPSLIWTHNRHLLAQYQYLLENKCMGYHCTNFYFLQISDAKTNVILDCVFRDPKMWHYYFLD